MILFKAKNQCFQGQRIPLLVENLDKTLKELIPKARETYFIRPIEVPVWLKDEELNEQNYDIYYKLLEEFEKKNISRVSLELTYDWFDHDKTHLHPKKAFNYWEQNFDDIFVQIREKNQ